MWRAELRGTSLLCRLACRADRAFELAMLNARVKSCIPDAAPAALSGRRIALDAGQWHLHGPSMGPDIQRDSGLIFLKALIHRGDR